MYNFPRPAGHNNGGLIQFWFVPLAWVLSVPADLNSVIFGNIVLAAGKKFLTGYASFGKLSYKEPDDDSANGTLYNQGLSGKCPCDNPALTDLFRMMKYDNRYLLIYKDVNDNFKLAGSLTEPLRFSYELKKGISFADYNGYEYSFACKSTKPSLFYHGTFETDAVFFDNSFTSKILALPEIEKKNIREKIGNKVQFTFEALPGTRDIFTFRAPFDGYLKGVDALENVATMTTKVNKHVYNLWYGYNQILADAPVGEYAVRKNDIINVAITRSDPMETAKIGINLFPEQKTINKTSVVRGGIGRWLVVLNYVSQTLSLIDTTKLNSGYYLGTGAWSGLTVLTFTIPAGTYVYSRMIYNPAQNCFDLFSRDRVTRFVIDDSTPANSNFYNQARTTLYGSTFYPQNALSAEVCAVEYIPGNQDMSAKYFIAINSNAFSVLMCDADDVSNSANFVDNWANWTLAGRLSYLPDLDILVGSTSAYPFAMFVNPRAKLDCISPFNPFSPTHNQPPYPEATHNIIGVSERLANIGTAKFDHKRGWILLQCENGVMQIDSTTFRAFRTAQVPITTRYSKFCLAPGTPYDVYFCASNVSNNIGIGWATATENEQNFAPYLPYNLPKTVPAVNELGTRDLIYCPQTNVIVAQGMRNGNQTTGVDRLHVIDVATKAYIGYIVVGNMDARSSTYAEFGNQIAIDFYDN